MSTNNNLFYCKTTEGYIIKSVFELLKNNIKQGCFVISNNSISLRMTDSNNKILIDLVLLAENFIQYKYTKSQEFFVGINIPIMYSLVREIKKKDSIALYIENDNLTDLYVSIIPKDGVAITTGKIKIQNFQSVEIETPSLALYSNPKILHSNAYGKIIKSLSGNVGGNIITVSSTLSNIQFIGSSNGICSRNVLISNDIIVDEKEDGNKIIQEFETEQLIRISKISSLSTQLQCYQKDELPLFIKTNIGNLGVLKIFLKDKSQYE